MSRPGAVCATSQEGRGAGGVGASLGTVGGRADTRTWTSSRTGAGDPRPDPGPGTLVPGLLVPHARMIHFETRPPFLLSEHNLKSNIQVQPFLVVFPVCPD